MLNAMVHASTRRYTLSSNSKHFVLSMVFHADYVLSYFELCQTVKSHVSG